MKKGAILAFDKEYKERITPRNFIKDATVAGTPVAVSNAFTDTARKRDPQTMKQTEMSLAVINSYETDGEKLYFSDLIPGLTCV